MNTCRRSGYLVFNVWFTAADRGVANYFQRSETFPAIDFACDGSQI